jgi:hypothetical protein
MMLGFLDLDAGEYDFDAANGAAVRGSSEQRRTSVNVNWQPSSAGTDFDPVRRADDLPDHRRRRLAALVADELHALGYDPGVDVTFSDRLAAAASTRGLRVEQVLLERVRPVWRAARRKD